MNTRRKPFQDFRPDTVLGPAIHATINGVPFPEMFGKFSPFATVFRDVKNGVKENEVIDFDVSALHGLTRPRFGRIDFG